MNEATCRFCRKSFRNRQAVRAHLRHCVAYRGRHAKTRSRQARSGRRLIAEPVSSVCLRVSQRPPSDGTQVGLNVGIAWEVGIGPGFPCSRLG